LDVETELNIIFLNIIENYIENVDQKAAFILIFIFYIKDAEMNFVSSYYLALAEKAADSEKNNLLVISYRK
jgi:hypothetical protein